jgi:hypothetical protein
LPRNRRTGTLRPMDHEPLEIAPTPAKRDFDRVRVLRDLSRDPSPRDRQSNLFDDEDDAYLSRAAAVRSA